uniref:uncharacterized protein LOC120331066 n=1 Tax=Styela clava TaxID=7725 RepID=UPI00193969EC|nr:uncharacterized protein LOC120331066 [Styela clava]
MELLLMILLILTTLCMGLVLPKPAEYGPVSENYICDVNYIKTTDCETIELDFLKDEYCCKKCPDGRKNPFPQHSISCSDIKEQPTTELENTTPEPFTTAIIETTTAAGTTTPYLPDDPTTTAVSIPQKITSEQDTKDEIDPPLVTATKLPGATIAAIVVSVIIGMIIAALAVYCYCKKKSQNTALEDKPLPVDEENPLVPDPQQADEQ